MKPKLLIFSGFSSFHFSFLNKANSSEFVLSAAAAHISSCTAFMRVMLKLQLFIESTTKDTFSSKNGVLKMKLRLVANPHKVVSALVRKHVFQKAVSTRR